MKITSLDKGLISKRFTITLLIFVFYLAILSQIKPIKIANLKLIDLLFLMRSKIHPAQQDGAKDTVLISIDDESMRRLDMKWPWSRSTFAEIIKRISEYEPAVICVDLVFIGKSKDEEEDLPLAKALKYAGNVILAAHFGTDGKYVVPEETIARYAKSFGFVNHPYDVDNGIRRMRPYALSKSGKTIDYSMAIKVAGEFIHKKPEDITSSIPLLKDNTAYINFLNKDVVPTISAWKVLEEKLSPNLFKGKMVFLGLTSKIFHDIYGMPFGQMPGVAITLTSSVTYAKENFFRYIGYPLNALILFIFTSIAVMGALSLKPAFSTLLSLAVIIVFSLFSVFLFLQNTIILEGFGVIFLTIIASSAIHGTRYVSTIIENARLRKEAITDGLTDIYVYRYFELKLRAEFAKAVSEDRGLALIIYDIDHFKQINDTYGHEFGNAILKAFAKILKENSRKGETVARYGGEEFCTIMPNTKCDSALLYAERIRRVIKDTRFTSVDGRIVQVTVSAGVATTGDSKFERYADLLQAADMALYKSKNSGRDRVSAFDLRLDSI